jgi:acetyltransferase-like isoleucine patch superfamily enzyme
MHREGKGRGRARLLVRRLGLVIAALSPGWVKRTIYRSFFGYQIASTARIGVAFLDCARLSIGAHTRIGNGTVFLGCGDVAIGSHVKIGPLNLFRGGKTIEIGDYGEFLRLNVVNAIPDHDCTNEPDSRFIMGYGSVVTSEHRIDFTDQVRIGRCSIVGGRQSSIWTHNRRTGKPVEIGNHCYLASEMRMAPGASVPDCSIVALGSVVSAAFSEPFSLISGVPATVVRALRTEEYDLIFAKTRPDLPDEPKPPGAGAG